MQLVHVRQNDNTLKTPQVRNQKEFAFLINCRSLLENGFSILQRYVKEHMSFSGQALWEVIADGTESHAEVFHISSPWSAHVWE